MKPAVLFFLFLCLHLVGRTDAGSAGGHGNKACFVPGGISMKGHALRLTSLKQDRTVAESSNEQSTDFTGVEDEDENETEVFARKKVRFEKCFSVFFDALLSRVHSDWSPVQVSFFNLLSQNDSCLYLSQKALRI